MNITEDIFKSPLVSVLQLQSEDLLKYANELDDFFQKELCLLSEQISDIQQEVSFCCNVSEEFKVDKCERKGLVLNSTKEMLSVKLKNLIAQEGMIISALKKEGNKLYKEVDLICRKYNLL